MDNYITGWHKSSYSDRDFENCVEVGHGPAIVGVRDTKQKHLAQQPTLVLDSGSFAAFLGHVVR